MEGELFWDNRNQALYDRQVKIAGQNIKVYVLKPADESSKKPMQQFTEDYFNSLIARGSFVRITTQNYNHYLTKNQL